VVEMDHGRAGKTAPKKLVTLSEPSPSSMRNWLKFCDVVPALPRQRVWEK